MGRRECGRRSFERDESSNMFSLFFQTAAFKDKSNAFHLEKADFEASSLFFLRSLCPPSSRLSFFIYLPTINAISKTNTYLLSPSFSSSFYFIYLIVYLFISAAAALLFLFYFRIYANAFRDSVRRSSVRHTLQEIQTL